MCGCYGSGGGRDRKTEYGNKQRTETSKSLNNHWYKTWNEYKDLGSHCCLEQVWSSKQGNWLSVCEFFCGQERRAVRILVSKQKYIRNTFLCHSSSHLDQPTRPWVLASSTGQRKEMCSKTSCTSVPFHSSCWVRLRWHKENSPVPLTLPAWAAQAKAWITAPSNCIAEGSSLRISILTLTIQISPDLAISCLSSFMCSSALQGTP